MRQVHVPVVDLFAGPGGLAEGFSALKHDRVAFDVALSVEKDVFAYRTLRLRSLFHLLSRRGGVRDEYYQYLKGAISEEDLFAAVPDEWAEAKSRCVHLEMGPRTTHQIYNHIQRAVGNTENWVLVGGPPCQAYSVVGRSRQSKLVRSTFEKDDKHILYREYLRILARYMPPVFVMENVKGLLSATFNGTSTFERILSDLSSPTVAVRESVNDIHPQTRRGSEYSIRSFVHPCTNSEDLKPQDYIIEAEKFGVPQRRHRVILLGVRSDLVSASNLSLRPSTAPPVQAVLADIPPVRSQLSREEDSQELWLRRIRSALLSLRGVDLDQEVREAMMLAAESLRTKVGRGGRSVPRMKGFSLPRTPLTDWLTDSRMDFVCNHETRKHISQDLLRYLFASCYAQVRPASASPKLHDFPSELLPQHKNVAETLRLKHGNFNDRFRVQVADQPATTVTSHIAKDGHYFIHHDPTQCRSWTVREAARVQTFPDNYFFEGARTDQYRQVGNAVPMSRIADCERCGRSSGGTIMRTVQRSEIQPFLSTSKTNESWTTSLQGSPRI